MISLTRRRAGRTTNLRTVGAASRAVRGNPGDASERARQMRGPALRSTVRRGVLRYGELLVVDTSCDRRRGLRCRLPTRCVCDVRSASAQAAAAKRVGAIFQTATPLRTVTAMALPSGRRNAGYTCQPHGKISRPGPPQVDQEIARLETPPGLALRQPLGHDRPKLVQTARVYAADADAMTSTSPGRP
jgi:hypothetical protein